ncbi:hypothetical protein OAH23_07595 [Verrucomicrobia bacterium]|nr:hypothetical protein [Verrucomicrobiota bacterium]MDB4690265.1 hypothetical protein [Verrucomicrobiota bacterium]
MRAQPFDAAWISAASGSWTDVFRWNTFGFLPFPNNDGQDEFNVLIALDASPTIQLSTDIEVVNLELAAGFVQGNATLTAEDRFLWRGGGFTGGKGQLIAPQKVTMTSGNKTLRGFNIINAREAEWLSGDVQSGTEGIFHNLENAVFKTDFDGSWLSDDSRPHGQFRNLGTFYKQESTGTTLIGCEYFNAGKTYLLSGNLKFAGPVLNESLFEASEDTVLEFAHVFESSQNASIASLNDVHFSSPLYTAKIQGKYSVRDNTILSGKEAVFHPETDLIDVGNTLSVQKGKVYFNSEESVTPQILILSEKGQILGKDTIIVQDYFLWGNGTSIGGEGMLHNLRRTEMARVDQTNGPRVLGNRLFVNSGELLWSAGDLVAFEKAVIINEIDSVFSIQGNVRSTAFMPKAYPQILNDGLLEITDAADNVVLDWNIQSSGTVKLPKGRVTIRGGLTLNGGQLLSDSSTLSTPSLKVQKAVLDGQLSISGNLQSFGRLDLLSSNTSLYVSDTVELDPSNQLHVAVSHSEAGTTKPSIYAGNILIAQGELVVHFHEDWKPQHGDTIPILESNLLLGEFRNVFPLRVNESYSAYPVYDSKQMSLLIFEDGNEGLPELNIFDIGDEIFLTWPRALSEHRLQFKSRFKEEEWTTYRRTFVNFATFSKEEPLMLFRLIAP